MATPHNDVPANPAPVKKPIKDLKDVFERPDIKERVKEVMRGNAAQFVTTVLQLASSSPTGLLTCEPVSVINGALTAAAMGLEINNNLGYAYLIPYRNNTKGGIMEAQFQVGYLGYKKLALNTGQFILENATDVRLGEIKGVDRLTGKMSFEWVQDDDEREALPIVGYLHYFKLNNGFESTFYMTIKKLKEHGSKYSKTYGNASSKWKTDEAAMCLKTVLKHNLKKNAPLSIENLAYKQLKLAIEADQSIVRDFDGHNADFDYEDNPSKDTEFEEVTPSDKASAAENATFDKLNGKK